MLHLPSFSSTLAPPRFPLPFHSLYHPPLPFRWSFPLKVCLDRQTDRTTQMKANPYKTSSIQLVHIFNHLPRQVGAVPAPLLAPTIPLQLYSLFQLKFAIITPPIISGTANLQPSLSESAANARSDLHKTGAFPHLSHILSTDDECTGWCRGLHGAHLLLALLYLHAALLPLRLLPHGTRRLAPQRVGHTTMQHHVT